VVPRHVPARRENRWSGVNVVISAKNIYLCRKLQKHWDLKIANICAKNGPNPQICTCIHTYIHTYIPTYIYIEHNIEGECHDFYHAKTQNTASCTQIHKNNALQEQFSDASPQLVIIYAHWHAGRRQC
jgi:hypothetical protein